MSTKKETTSRFDKWAKSNKKSNIFIGLITVGIVIRFGLYLYFGARFIIDVTFVLSVLALLLLITNKFNYKEPKETTFRKYFGWFKLVFLAMLVTVLYMDTFIASKDIYTIVSNTDEEFIYSYDLEGNGRRYFTISSEEIEKVERFPAYELSKGKIQESYFIDSKTGLLVDEYGETYIKE